MENREEQMLICPECNASNVAKVWDAYTAKMEGFKPNDMLGLSHGELEKHREFETEYTCPNCDMDISGAKLLSPDTEYED